MIVCLFWILTSISGLIIYPKNTVCTNNSTLEFGIDIASPPKNLNIRILINFYINQGIRIIFQSFFPSTFLKIIKRTPKFIPDSRVVVQTIFFSKQLFFYKSTLVVTTTQLNLFV